MIPRRPSHRDLKGFQRLEVSISNDERQMAEKALRDMMLSKTQLRTHKQNSTAKTLKTLKRKSTIQDNVNIVKMKLVERLQNLRVDEYANFNFDGICERSLLKQSQRVISKKDTNERKFENGMIVWAEWSFKKTKIMWPAIFKNIGRDSSGNQKARIAYIEQSAATSNIFSKKLSDVKPFFETPEHFEFKTSAAANPNTNLFEFFFCYTKALDEFRTYLTEAEKETDSRVDDLNGSNVNYSTALSTQLTNISDGDSASLNKDAHLSEIQNENVQLGFQRLRGREETRVSYSQKFFDILMSEESKEFLVAVIDKNYKEYVQAHRSDLFDAEIAKSLDRINTFAEEQRLSILSFVHNTIQSHVSSKSAYLLRYEEDVLYPEVVKWALQRVGLLYNEN